jgi:hypothetical protein
LGAVDLGAEFDPLAAVAVGDVGVEDAGVLVEPLLAFNR